MVVEVYTPGGNRSSYPPHKHDVHNPPEEVDLDEIYYYRMNQPGAFAFLEKQVSRVWCVHLKDIYETKAAEARRETMNFHAAVRHEIFAPLGKAGLISPGSSHS